MRASLPSLFFVKGKPMSKKKSAVCPRCGREYTEFPALSRVDNTTHICSSCGTDEALFNFRYPGEELTPVDRPVWI